MVSTKSIVILSGPTATGKTSLAIEFCQKNAIEIINADSIQVYRGADIGSDKVTAAEQKGVPHHLLDQVNLNETYTAANFYQQAQTVIAEIQSRDQRAMIVGGTGFYLKALLYGLWDAVPTDEEFRKNLEAYSNESLHQKLQRQDPDSIVKPGDRYRLIRALEILHGGKRPSELEKQHEQEPNPQFKLCILNRPNEELFPRIEARVQTMLDSGWVEETQKILQTVPHSPVLKAVGYRQIVSYLQGMSPPGRKVRAGRDGLHDEITLAHRQLVKKQRTWFRGEKSAKWFTLEQDRNQLMETLNRVYST